MFYSAFKQFSDLGVISRLPELAGAGSSIVLSPTSLAIPSNASIGTLVGTASVAGGIGVYTFGLIDPSGQFAIDASTGAITVASALTLGTYSITVNASNGLGDAPTLPTTIAVVAIGSGTGAAAGIGGASAVGAALVSAIATAAGTGTAPAIGGSIVAGAGSAAGVGAASAIGTETISAVGSAAGTGTASAAGIGSVVAAAAGLGSASAVGSSTASSAGSNSRSRPDRERSRHGRS